MEEPDRAGAGAICARTDVQDALARGDWSTVLQAFLDAGLSQTVVARRAGISQSQVSRLTSRKSRDPGMKTVRALCEALAIPKRLAGLVDDDAAEEESATDRREFLAGSIGIAAVAAIPHSDLGDERYLLSTTLSYRQLEQRIPSRSLVQPVTAHLALACDMARRSTGKQRARLFATVAEAAGLAAWLHADLVEPIKVRHFYDMSIKAARQSGRSLLAIYMQGSLGQYAATTGDPVYAVQQLRDATAQLPPSAAPEAFAWLSTMEAVARGYLRDRSALSLLDEAERRLNSRPADQATWPWVFPFDTGRINSYRAIAASRLNRAKVAIDAFQRAGSLARSPKQAAILNVEHARALALAGHGEQACSVAVAAYDVGANYESERVHQAVRDFRQSLGTQLPSRITAELDDRLRSAYRTGGR